ncbi:MAG: hypothetical protein R6V85_14470 [Polyangia bacterium]
MTTDDRRIERALRQLDRADPAPDFERSWREAEDRARAAGAGRSAWRWALGPGLAACAAALAVVALLHEPAPEVEDAVASGAGAAGLEGLATPRIAKTGLGELLEREPSEQDSELASGPWSGGLLAVETDFLLVMEVPAWERAGERNER